MTCWKMVEPQRERIILTKEMGGTKFSEGDVVLVLRDVGVMAGHEQAGLVHDIEPAGRVFIDYGGYISLLHDEEQIRHAPLETREELKLKLEQKGEETRQWIEHATRNIRKALENHRF